MEEISRGEDGRFSGDSMEKHNINSTSRTENLMGFTGGWHGLLRSLLPSSAAAAGFVHPNPRTRCDRQLFIRSELRGYW